MKTHTIKLLCLLLFLLPGSTAYASEEEIRSVALQWAEGIGLGDPDYMLSFYAEDAILHPTVSSEMRIGHEQIRDYFTGLEGTSALQLFVEPMNIRIYGDLAVNTGFYTVQLSPEQETLQLRYSFVYLRQGNDWSIIDHHSSPVPE